MQRLINSIVSFSFVALAFVPSTSEAQMVRAYFSPRGGCETAIAAELRNANDTIVIAAYQLTSQPLLCEIRQAAYRHVSISIIVDKAMESRLPAGLAQLHAYGVQLRTDAAEKIHHNKYCVIDGKTVITGSYNWSKNAESHNAENLVIIADADTASAFCRDFSRHWSHSRPFTPKQRAAQPHVSPPQLSACNHWLPTRKECLRWHVLLVHYFPSMQLANTVALWCFPGGRGDTMFVSW